VLVEGTGAQPKAEEEVEVKYEGKLIDGTVFDSSYKRNPQTAKFRCNQVIKGWTEALTMMPVGSKWELYIPQELAYGDRQAGKINPYSTLIFTVELLDIVQPDAKAEAKRASSVKRPSERRNRPLSEEHDATTRRALFAFYCPENNQFVNFMALKIAKLYVFSNFIARFVVCYN